MAGSSAGVDENLSSSSSPTNCAPKLRLSLVKSRLKVLECFKVALWGVGEEGIQRGPFEKRIESFSNRTRHWNNNKFPPANRFPILLRSHFSVGFWKSELLLPLTQTHQQVGRTTKGKPRLKKPATKERRKKEEIRG